MKKGFFLFVSLVFFIFSTNHVFAAATIYRSVGSGAVASLAQGGANSLTVSGSVATFASPLPTNIGVGDAVVFASNTATDTIAFVTGRTSSTVYNLATAAGGSVATTTTGSTQIWSIYRAYTSLQNVIAGTKNTGIPAPLRNFDTYAGVNNIVTADQQWNIALYGNGTNADTGPVDLKGSRFSTSWTTDATRYINIYTPTLSSEVGVSQRAAGVWDTTKFHITSGEYYGTFILPASIYITINGVQIENTRNQGTGESGDAIYVTSTNGGGSITVLNSIMRKSGTAVDGYNNALGPDTTDASSPAAFTVTIANNIIYGFYNNLRFINFEGKIYVYNNTIVSAAASTKGIVISSNGTASSGSTQLYIKNNISSGHSGGDYSITNSGAPGNLVRLNNVSSDATATGTNSKANQTVAFVSTSTPDYHLLGSDTAAHASGINLSADPSYAFSTDIDGQTRVAPWDIGADQFIDVSPPSVPGSLAATPASPTVINLTWASSTDNVAVTGYNIYRCTGASCSPTSVLASTTQISYRDSTLATSTVYGYAVTAFDAASNESAQSSTVSTTTLANDIIPPVISNGSPSGTLAATTTSVTLSVTTDKNATCKYGTVANTAYASIANTFSTTGVTTHSQNISGLSAGTYNYYVRCMDTSSNIDTSDYTVTFTISNPDVTPPTVTLTLPLSGATVSGTSTPLSATSSDNVAVVGVQFKIDGVNLGTEITGSSITTATSSWNTGSSTDGTHSLVAVARDAAGNYATSTSVTVTVSNAPSIPTGFTAYGVSPTYADIRWNFSTSSVSTILGYHIYRNGVRLPPAILATTQYYTDTLLTASTSYSYTIDAFDSAGRTSASSTAVVATTNPLYVGGNPPALPLVYINSAATSTPVTGTTWTATSSAQLTSILANPSLALGDEIVLTAGNVYTGPFTLPNLATGSGWLTIRTSDMAGLPTEGNRVSSTTASHMPKLMANASNGAIETAVGAHNIRLIGLEIGINSGLHNTSGLVFLGRLNNTSLSSLPHDIILDRMYIHGNTLDENRRGVAMNAATSTVVDSYISDFHECGSDSQAIAVYNGAGPFKVVNNYLEAATENFSTGGSDPTVIGMRASDLEFRHNYLYKQPTWKNNVATCSSGTAPWEVKNIFEFKTMQRALVDGNILDGNWDQAQDGSAINFKSTNQGGSTGLLGAYWEGTTDVTFSNNIIRNSGAFVKMYADPDGGLVIPMQRIAITNNLGYAVDTGIYTGQGSGNQLGPNLTDITYTHNTLFASSTQTALTIGGAMNDALYNNNILAGGAFSVKAGGVSEGTPTVNLGFSTGQFLKNLVTSSNSPSFPAGNVVLSAVSAINFVNASSNDYHLASSSPGHAAATDGTDMGANIDAINTATAGVVAGDNVAPALSNGSPSGTLAATTTSVTLSVTTDKNATCKYGTVANTAYASIANTFSTTGVTTHSQNISGLSAGTYNYYVRCMDVNSFVNSADYTISFTIPAGDTIPPTVSLTAPSNASTVSGSAVTISATASDNVAVAGVQFKVDTNTNIGIENLISPYSVTWNSTGVSDGTHTIIAVARDTSNNYATSSSISITVDNTAPVRSAGSPSGALTAGTTTAVISLTTNEAATCKYDINAGTAYASMSGSFTTTGGTTHSKNLTGLSVGSYNYYIRCVDAYSNTNTSDYIISFSIPAVPDTTPPVVSLTAPSNASTVSGSSVTVSSTASDNVGVVGVQFKLDGINLSAEDTSLPYVITWNSTTALDGAHTLSAVARDAAGNYATSSVSVVVDNTAPIISGGSPSGVLSTSTTAVTLSVATNENATCKYGTVANTAYASIANTFSTTGVTTHSQNISGLSAGTYNYYVRCVDSYLNANASDYLVSFSIPAVPDTTPPVITVLSPQGTLSSGTTFTNLTLATNKNATCRFDTVAGKAYSSMGGTFGTTGTTQQVVTFNNLIGATTYTYYIRCIDGLGNTNISDTVATFSVAASPAASATSTALSGGVHRISSTSGASVTSITTKIAKQADFVQANKSVIIEAQARGIEVPAALLEFFNMTPSVATLSISRNLAIGTQGSEVKELQKFLISAHVGLAADALANHGVTTTFGPLTKAALVEFQTAAGIPATGYFGPITRAFIKNTTK